MISKQVKQAVIKDSSNDSIKIASLLYLQDGSKEYFTSTVRKFKIFLEIEKLSSNLHFSIDEFRLCLECLPFADFLVRQASFELIHFLFSSGKVNLYGVDPLHEISILLDHKSLWSFYFELLSFLPESNVFLNGISSAMLNCQSLVDLLLKYPNLRVDTTIMEEASRMPRFIPYLLMKKHPNSKELVFRVVKDKSLHYSIIPLIFDSPLFSKNDLIFITQEILFNSQEWSCKESALQSMMNYSWICIHFESALCNLVTSQEDAYVRIAALKALSSFKKYQEIKSILLYAISLDFCDIRLAALKAALNYKNELECDFVDKIKTLAIDDCDAEVRRAAIEILFHFDQSACHHLCLDDASNIVRRFGMERGFDISLIEESAFEEIIGLLEYHRHNQHLDCE